MQRGKAGVSLVGLRTERRAQVWSSVSREGPPFLIWRIIIASERSCPCGSLPTLNPSYYCLSSIIKIVIIDNIMEHIKCIRH